MTTVAMQVPSGTTTVVAKSGSTYSADVSGVILVTIGNGDLPSLLDAGCKLVSSTGLSGINNTAATTDPTTTSDSTQDYAVGSIWYNTSGKRLYTCTDATASAAVWRQLIFTTNAAGANGLFATTLALTSGKNADGSSITATAAASGFATSMSFGTSEALAGEAAKSNTKTDTVYFEHVLPQNYIAASNITVTVNALYAGTGAIGTKTIQVLAYKSAAAGTQGADIGSGTTANLTNANAAYSRVITGTSLVPGNKIFIAVTTAIQETGGSNNLNAQINSIVLS